MVLLKAQAISILRRAIITREGFSKLRVLLGLLPLSIVDMLHATSESFGT